MFQHLYETTLEQLLAAFDAWPLPLPAAYATNTGKLRGKVYTIDNVAYATDKLRKLRISRVRADDAYILNVMVFPHPEYDMPIFGAELMAFRGAPHLVVIDHQPLWKDGAAYVQHYLAPLEALYPLYAHLPTRDRSLPAWTEMFFSPYTIYSRPTLAELDLISGCYRECWAAYLQMVAQAQPVPSERSRTLARQAEYCTNHTDNEPGETMLQKLFGDEWFATFVHDFLFDVHVDMETQR